MIFSPHPTSRSSPVRTRQAMGRVAEGGVVLLPHSLVDTHVRTDAATLSPPAAAAAGEGGGEGTGAGGGYAVYVLNPRVMPRRYAYSYGSRGDTVCPGTTFHDEVSSSAHAMPGPVRASIATCPRPSLLPSHHHPPCTRHSLLPRPPSNASLLFVPSIRHQRSCVSPLMPPSPPSFLAPPLALRSSPSPICPPTSAALRVGGFDGGPGELRAGVGGAGGRHTRRVPQSRAVQQGAVARGEHTWGMGEHACM
ncbi:unnamed protein product, partial [Closterium sp. NIES-54]